MITCFFDFPLFCLTPISSAASEDSAPDVPVDMPLSADSEGRGSQMGSVLRRNLRAQSHDRMLAGSTRGRAMNNEGKMFLFRIDQGSMGGKHININQSYIL